MAINLMNTGNRFSLDYFWCISLQNSNIRFPKQLTSIEFNSIALIWFSEIPMQFISQYEQLIYCSHSVRQQFTNLNSCHEVYFPSYSSDSNITYDLNFELGVLEIQELCTPSDASDVCDVECINYFIQDIQFIGSLHFMPGIILLSSLVHFGIKVRHQWMSRTSFLNTKMNF